MKIQIATCLKAMQWWCLFKVFFLFNFCLIPFVKRADVLEVTSGGCQNKMMRHYPPPTDINVMDAPAVKPIQTRVKATVAQQQDRNSEFDDP